MGWYILIFFVAIIIYYIYDEKKKKRIREDNNEKWEKAKKLREQQEKEEQVRKFIEKHGCTQEELIKGFRESQAVDKIAKIIIRETQVKRTSYQIESISIFANKIEFNPPIVNTSDINFEKMGLSRLPEELIIYLTDVLLEKLDGHYKYDRPYRSDKDPNYYCHTIERDFTKYKHEAIFDNEKWF